MRNRFATVDATGDGDATRVCRIAPGPTVAMSSVFSEIPASDATVQDPDSSSDKNRDVIGQLFAFIRRRNFEPGDRLPSERELAERFGVGRGAIREALATLEAIRFVKRRPNSGVYLASSVANTSLEALVLYADAGIELETQTVAQCIEVRRLVEVQAVRVACERRTDNDLRELDAILAEFQDAIAAGERAGDLDQAFHMRVLRATGNKVLVQILTPFYAMSHRRRLAFFDDADRARRSHEQHVEIVDAIRARDADLAADLMSRHIGRVEEFFLGRRQGAIPEADSGAVASSRS